jgi:hypothetical protein
MRGFFRKRSAAAVIAAALVVALLTPGAYAEDDPSPYQPPEARIRPPTGTASTATVVPSTGAPTDEQVRTFARIRPPTGEPDEGEPGGNDDGMLALLFGWLQLRLNVAIR